MPQTKNTLEKTSSICPCGRASGKSPMMKRRSVKWMTRRFLNDGLCGTIAGNLIHLCNLWTTRWSWCRKHVEPTISDVGVPVNENDIVAVSARWNTTMHFRIPITWHRTSWEWCCVDHSLRGVGGLLQHEDAQSAWKAEQIFMCLFMSLAVSTCTSGGFDSLHPGRV